MIGSPNLLVGSAVELVRALFPLEKRVRLLGVTLSGFEGSDREEAAQGRFDF